MMRCPVHLAVDMTELPPPRKLKTWYPEEDAGVEIPRRDFRCPVWGCARVATVNQPVLTDANRHRCRLCGRPIRYGQGNGGTDYRHTSCKYEYEKGKREERKARLHARRDGHGLAVPLRRKPGRPRSYHRKVADGTRA